ncbi:MAG: hypothetical protein GTN55_09815, partial [Gammaproteobacteria bacterium]|nr:hypothetical protein [Gammaproteobacteria bacterium]NIO61348.1 hypothetical protein [Gammaproteobacteria bacterium]NIT06448.1 hypothetical protein [Gammaproteobacteria bacterium]
MHWVWPLRSSVSKWCNDAFGKDHSLHAMSYFMTQAQAMGYGTCVIGHVQSAHKLVAQHVKIKKYHRVFGAITLGRPKTVYRRTVSRTHIISSMKNVIMKATTLIQYLKLKETTSLTSIVHFLFDRR